MPKRDEPALPAIDRVLQVRANPIELLAAPRLVEVQLVFDRDEVRGAAFNFGPQKPHTVLEVVEVIRRLMKRMDLEPDVRNEAQAEIRHQYLCADKAQRVLGWTPAWPLKEGLAKTIEWYIQFLDARG